MSFMCIISNKHEDVLEKILNDYGLIIKCLLSKKQAKMHNISFNKSCSKGFNYYGLIIKCPNVF